MTKAFVLHSGGVDSTTCLYLAVYEYGADNVTAYSIDYGQRHSREIRAAQDICKLANVEHHTLQLSPQPKSNLTDENAEIPRISYDEMGFGMSPSYHHFRNGQLLSLLAAYAVAALTPDKGEEGIIYAGMHAEDAQNWAYADCTPGFISAMQDAIQIGTYGRVFLKVPLLNFLKHEVVGLGNNLSVPWEYTWSCYLGGEKHCGTCPTCRARQEAFHIAGVDDPTEYEEDPNA